MSQTEVPTFWWHSHSRFRLPEFIRNAAVSFREYWRQVVESFVRDLRYFMSPLPCLGKERRLQGVPGEETRSAQSDHSHRQLAASPNYSRPHASAWSA